MTTINAARLSYRLVSNDEATKRWDNGSIGIPATEKTNSIGALFEIDVLDHAFYGEKAYSHILACIDAARMKQGRFYSGDLIQFPMFTTHYVVAYTTECLDASKHFRNMLDTAHYIQIGRIPDAKAKNLYPKRYDSLKALGRLLNQNGMGIWAMNEAVERLPLICNGEMENGVITARKESPLAEALGSIGQNVEEDDDE